MDQQSIWRWIMAATLFLNGGLPRVSGTRCIYWLGRQPCEHLFADELLFFDLDYTKVRVPFF